MTNEFDTPNLEHKIRTFPCYICVVKAACRDYIKCELVTKNKQQIYKFLIQGRCPDCGNKKKLIGYEIHGCKCKYCCDCKHTFIIDSDRSKLAERR